MPLHRCTPLLRVLPFLGVAASTSLVSGQTPRTITQLGDGVYEIRHRDGQDGFEGGNTTVIIGERQVFVVDATLVPSESREDIAQIRQWTNKPVTFLLNTHFHNDHDYGNRAYMDAFPGITIIAHEETKREMDLFGPGSAARMERGPAAYTKMLESGKGPDGSTLTEGDRQQLKNVLARHEDVVAEMRASVFQSATMTFAHDFTIDLGNRDVQVKFLGRGNTPGDAVVFLPKERIAVVGDLVVHPMPYFYDGYPTEWIVTLDRLARLDPAAVVPGHGPVLRDLAYVHLIQDLLKSATEQMTQALRKSGPAMFRTVDDVKGSIDLTPFRQRFAGTDAELSATFDQVAATLIKLVFREASLR